MDKRSFILGMVTAFCECVAAGCKDLALSPPMTHADYEMVVDEAERIIEKHGLIHAHEENPELPEEERFEWILIASREETFCQYQELRKQGYAPSRSLKPFSRLLSYQEAKSISTGYDAYREYFT